MLFNSLIFFIFFIVVFALYWMLRHPSQNRLLLIAGYIFYSAWDWRFSILLFLSTAVDYFCALQIEKRPTVEAKQKWLIGSLSFNLGILGFFKYFNFFADNLVGLFSLFNIKLHFLTVRVLLPVGISFYTFQSMGYVIDVYRNKFKAVRNFIDFAVFVSFFPQLVAGPIERAAKMIPQIQAPRQFNLQRVREGGWLILWGLFKKTVMADNFARLADAIFNSGAHPNAISALIGVYAFAIQIYGDFSGYTDIARGTAKWLGFELMQNFRSPYLAISPADFWHRWHISLSTWLRDYLYIPLGGSKKGKFITYRNLFITMLLGGLWHGAAWTYVLWGAYHGILLIADKICAGLFPEISKRIPKIVMIFLTFHLICFGWIFFRAENMQQALNICATIFSGFNLKEFISLVFFSKLTVGIMTVMAVLFFIYKACHENPEQSRWTIFQLPAAARIPIYIFLIYAILMGGAFNAKQFIYFQF